MSQIEIARILRNKYPDFVSYQELMKISKLSKASVLRNLKALGKRDEIQIKMVWGNKLRSRWQKLYRLNE
jgi:predicted transcriptional regulator